MCRMRRCECCSGSDFSLMSLGRHVFTPYRGSAKTATKGSLDGKARERIMNKEVRGALSPHYEPGIIFQTGSRSTTRRAYSLLALPCCSGIVTGNLHLDHSTRSKKCFARSLGPEVICQAAPEAWK